MQTKDLLPSEHGRALPARLLVTVVVALTMFAGTNAEAAATPAVTTTASLCPAPAPGYASCAAQAVVTRGSRTAIHPHLQRAFSVARTHVPGGAAPLAVQADTEPAAAPLPPSGTPAFIQQAYDLTYLSETAGGSATVGIIDAYNDPTAASDLATYRAYYGLPACTTANGCLTVDAQTSTTSSGWAGEVALDLDAVSAVCPNCHIVLVEAASSSLPDLMNAIQTAHQLGATYLSNSWGEAGGALPDSGFSFSGSTTFASAGDSGYTGSPQYPAALSDVTAVGGTSLTYAPQTARGYTESAWSDGGSGCDTGQSKPSWQTNDDTGCSGRSYSDLAADADPETGLNVYSSTYGGWVLFGGTSLASPMTAAYYALIGNAGVTDAWPYQNVSLLNDVTTGTNVQGTGCQSDPGICTAGIGFDGPTGNGTISGDAVPGAPGVGSNGYSAGVTGSSATVTVGVYPNRAATQVYLEYGPSGQGYTGQTPAQSLGAGAQATQATFTLADVAAGYHYRVVASNAYGTTYGYDVALATADGWPTVTGASVTPTSSTSAQAAFSVDYAGSGSLDVVYGPTTSYGITTASQPGSSSTSGTVTLTGLQPGTTYHWAIVITNGSHTFTTPDGTFTTPGPSPASGDSNAGSKAGAGAGSTPVPSGSSGTSAGAPSSKGLTVVSVKGGADGHYDVEVTCTATVGCAGHVSLIQRLTGGRTRTLGTAYAALKRGASVIIRFTADSRAAVTTAVAARAPAVRRLPARSQPRADASDRHR